MASFLTRLKKAWAVLVGEEAAAPPEPKALPPPPVSPDAAHASGLFLLGMLQREGRLIDFLQEDVAGFSDAEVGAAARVVHDGCRKALRAHGKLVAVRKEDEGARVTVEEKETRSGAVKLTGNVAGSAPFSGALRHRGWRVEDLHLPEAAEGHDAKVIAPAEVEL